MKNLRFLPFLLVPSLSGCVSAETPPDENEVESFDDVVDAPNHPQGSALIPRDDQPLPKFPVFPLPLPEIPRPRPSLPPIKIDWTKLPLIPKPPRCEAIHLGEDPGLVDDFEGSGSRIGGWHQEVGGRSEPLEIITGTDPSTGVGYLDFECSTELWCNRQWDVAEAWGQWAVVTWTPDAGPTGQSCVDARTFEGIRFRGRSGNGADRVSVTLNTPDSVLETFEGYNSEEKTLKGSWSIVEIPFEEFEKPHWSLIPSVLSRSEITSIVFVARTVQPMNDDGRPASSDDEIVGERLLPHDIEIDWVEFY